MFVIGTAAAAEPAVHKAGAYRKAGQAVMPMDDTTVVAEAEEFHVDAPGWKARPGFTSYYAATLANTFLSRKAYLSAPEQCDSTSASITVQVPKAGKYLALVRYEAAYRFQTQFRLAVEQGGRKRLDRLYGARENQKIWAFGNKLKTEVQFSWGAGESVVWEGHDALVDLDAGPAKLTLSAGKQPTPAAERHVDLVMLTSDLAQVKERIEKENYLPLDGMMTQAGDIHLKLHNKGSTPLGLNVSNGTEHSPYWVHLRKWKPKKIEAQPGKSTGWEEAGSLLDSLSDGQWKLTTDGKGPHRYDLEVGLRGPDGSIATIRRFSDLTGPVELAYDADTRYSGRIRNSDEVLYDLVDFLKKQPVQGKAPQRTLVYGYTFVHRDGEARYNAGVDEFIRIMGGTAFNLGTKQEVPTGGLVRGYMDLRGQTADQLKKTCDKLKAEGKADKIAVISLGDEIGLAQPPATDHAGFQAWLRSQSVNAMEVDSASGGDLAKVQFDPKPATAKAKPALYYYSQMYAYRYGIRQLKALTDVLRANLPNAGIGANFSPHAGNPYIGPTHHWISLFREDGMTMPWGEDYIFQVATGTQQMNSIMLDMYRAAIKGKPDRKIHYYVMPHWPGNTPGSWRRQFYGDLAHGAKIFNLFEFRPVQAAYTENHCSSPEMYQEVRKSLHELGTFEELIQDGQVAPAKVGLWFSDAADVWDDYRASFAAGKRTLWTAIRHQQLPLDMVLDGDDLQPLKVLYLADEHVSRAGSKAIAAWVNAGGTLFATAGAGLMDELNQPNRTMRELYGIEPKALEVSDTEMVRLEKQDLPFAKPLDEVSSDGKKSAVIGVRNRFVANMAQVLAKFSDGSPAVVERQVGKGKVIYCGFLPGLSYFKPALPMRPVDRNSSEDSLAHFIPTEFDKAAAELIGLPARDLQRPVSCSEPLVESSIIQAKQGAVIPLINWTMKPVKGLVVAIDRKLVKGNVKLASGGAVTPEPQDGKDGYARYRLDLDVADALIVR